MILSSRKFVVGLFGVGAITLTIMACGSDDESKFHDSPPPNVSFLPQDGGLGGDAGDDPYGDLYKDDPPAAWCGAEAGAPPPPGGTAECPDDKNKPGCGCAKVGDIQPCWTGLRKNRNLGECHDGKTECMAAGENHNVWGPCEGQKLPEQNATGEAACSCFSIGLWKIDNTAPCVWNPSGDTFYAYSTLQPPAGSTAGPGKCTPTDHLESGQKTPENWSTDRLTTDCAGSFTLCYRIRVGDYKNPSPNDCIMGESCVFADYQQSGVEQELPPLPSWNSTDSACAKKWEKDTPDDVSPGYGEMIVKGGKTVRCEAVSNVPDDQEFVFNRVQYCARKCRDAAHQQDADCVECQLKGQGHF